MPLIRFELGDSGHVEEAACACGRSSPQIAGISGRLAEMLSFPDGTWLSPYLLTTAIEKRPTVEHFRVVHEQPWALRVEIFARPALPPSDRQGLAASLRTLLPAQVALRVVELADRGPHTKRRAVLREFE